MFVSRPGCMALVAAVATVAVFFVVGAAFGSVVMPGGVFEGTVIFCGAGVGAGVGVGNDTGPFTVIDFFATGGAVGGGGPPFGVPPDVGAVGVVPGDTPSLQLCPIMALVVISLYLPRPPYGFFP